MTEGKKINRIDSIFKEYADDKFDYLKMISEMSNDEIIRDLTESGLRGRGGAGFPTGDKWKYAAAEPGDEKYVICNADEGEPGTFKDKEILMKVPHKVLTGMTACAKVTGAKKGYIYLRWEYKFMRNDLQKFTDEFNRVLKDMNIDFEIGIVTGAGAYVCGEESALFDSMEGMRGEPRNKPPFPTASGFMNKPTVINNVETFAASTMILLFGGKSYAKLGTDFSHGSKLFCVSGDTDKPGIYELELGMTLHEFVEKFGDGDTKAVSVGGVSGALVPRKKFKDTVIGWEGVPTGGAMILFNSTRSIYHILHNYLEFFEEESCGQCTPCRIGCQQLRKGIEEIKKGEMDPSYLDTLSNLSKVMNVTAKCGLGQSVMNPFTSAVTNFKEELLY